jgi:4-amino-4-deoxy-L-arabinose transferase-like glycosyltransferase
MIMNIEQNGLSDRYEWQDILLLVCACLIVFIGLGDRMLWGSEGRWAEVTREMRLTGDYFHPTINGEPYFDKPLVTYWFIAAIALVTGTLNEHIVRLPSAIAGLAAVWATMRLGRRLWSPSVGRIAACILMTSYGFVLWSRSGAADSENLATVVLCTLWYWYRRDKLNFTTFLVLYLIVFVGSLTKGPVAAVVAALVILPDIVNDKRWKAFLRPTSLFALAAGLAVYLIPFIWAAKTNPASYNSSGLALVWQENIQRFFTPIDHKGPVYTYISAVPVLILPWAPLFIAALIAGFKYSGKLDRNAQWLIKVIVLIFVFFTLSGSRRNYYILPIIPFCALLTAVVLTRIKEFEPSGIMPAGFNIQRGLILGTAICELVAAVVFLVVPVKTVGVPLAGICTISIMVVVAAIAAAAAASKLSHRLAVPSEEKAFFPLAVAAMLVMGGFFCVQQNALEKHSSERKFIVDIQSAAANMPVDRVALLQKGEVDAKVLFYLGKGAPVTLLRYNEKSKDADKLADNKKAIMSFLQSSQPGVLIAQTRYAKALPTECSNLLPSAPTFEEKPLPFESESSQQERWMAWLLNSQSTMPVTGEKTTNEN